jgi:hypothetical protein
MPNKLRRAATKRIGNVGPAAPVSKFQRYRQSKAERGQKLLRVWVNDPSHPGFAEEARRQAALLRGRPEEQEALTFIEHAFDWPE